MKFPYGVANFATIINEGYKYVDRTDRIPAIEQSGHQLLFLRPRRFGKSLLLSMLEHYYSVAKADGFEQLFGQLAIGPKPTPCTIAISPLSGIFPSLRPRAILPSFAKPSTSTLTGVSLAACAIIGTTSTLI